ncbi:MAG TPA: hypothetical protein VJU86_23395 [Pyrinomonadaceae bacterium]|nr:hypothetical protein [Pyrinomonadaceae bacterium]
MDQIRDYENECERYLLGSMSEQEQAHFEEQYFENDDLFERFLAVKDGLIDAYARNQLRADLRPQFEQHFLATGPRRQRIEEARQFIRAINESAAAGTGAERSVSTSWWQTMPVRWGIPPLAFHGALVLLITAALLGGFLWLKNIRNRQTELARVEQVPPFPTPPVTSSPAVPGVSPVDDKNGDPGRPTQQPSPSPSPTANRQPSQPAPAQVASLTLIPFAPRDGSSSNTLQLPQDAKLALLNLTFKNAEYRSYSVSLKTLAGEPVLQRSRLKATSVATGNSLILTIDPALLKHQDYIITLSGLSKSGQTESLADYYFRVQRMPSR